MVRAAIGVVLLVGGLRHDSARSLFVAFVPIPVPDATCSQYLWFCPNISKRRMQLSTKNSFQNGYYIVCGERCSTYEPIDYDDRVNCAYTWRCRCVESASFCIWSPVFETNHQIAVHRQSKELKSSILQYICSTTLRLGILLFTMRSCISLLFLFVAIICLCRNVPVCKAFSIPFTTMARQQIKTIGQRKSLESSPEAQFNSPERLDLTILRASSEGKDSTDHETDHHYPSNRLRRWRKRLSKFGKTIILASALLVPRSKPAEAKFAYEIREERKYSIRPGATQEQASKLIEGEVPDDISESKSIFDTQSQSEKDQVERQKQQQQQQLNPQQKPKSAFDYGDEDDEEDDYLEFQERSSVASSKKGLASQAERKVAERLQSTTRSQFSGIDPSKTKSRALYLKVSVGLFIPTWGAMGVREFVRRRKEEVYVKKGLEILEAQKAEYFNVTETTSDSDIEDELKDLKDGDEDDDSDDDADDADDDDDDDEEPKTPPPSSRKGPKRPSGGGGSDGNSGGSGDGRPSDDDLKRLGDLFNKS